MIAKKIKYTDVDEVEHEDTFYFHLDKGELISLELGEEKGMSTKIQKLIDTKDNKQIIATVKEIVVGAVGKKKGNLFIKNEDIRDEFEFSGAYGELLIELLDNDKAAENTAAFINGILPKSARA